MAKESESMSDGVDQWIPALLKLAKESNPLVTDQVIERLETLLKREFSERELTPANMKTIAAQLLEYMNPQPQGLEETQ